MLHLTSCGNVNWYLVWYLVWPQLQTVLTVSKVLSLVTAAWTVQLATINILSLQPALFGWHWEKVKFFYWWVIYYFEMTVLHAGGWNVYCHPCLNLHRVSDKVVKLSMLVNNWAFWERLFRTQSTCSPVECPKQVFPSLLLPHSQPFWNVLLPSNSQKAYIFKNQGSSIYIYTASQVFMLKPCIIPCYD